MAIQAQFPSCGWQDWMDNGCGELNPFYFNVQQQQKQQQQQQQQQPLLQQQQQLLNQQLRHQNPCLGDSFLAPSSTLKNSNNNINHPSVGDYSHHQSMSAYHEKQRQELDHYIRLQNERLRLLMHEQIKQHLAILVKRIELKAMPFLAQKDEEIAQATKRTIELEDLLRRLEIENQVWQRVAQENEAMVMSLNNTIEQLREKASTCFNADNDNIAGDAESCCDMNRGQETEKTEQRNRGLAFDNNRNNIIKEDVHRQDRDNTGETMVTMMVCKGCNSRNSCVLFLPCRHLSSCKACEAFLESCPVCQTPKKASIEALMV